MTYDPWQTLANETRGIEGLDVRCRKGDWTVNGEPFETGDAGTQLAFIMPTAVIGEIDWVDGKPGKIRTGRIEDRFTAAKPPLAEGWSAHTSVLIVFATGERTGQLGTFSSSGWGGRYAFQSLVRPYKRKSELEFPLCTLHTRERGDKNGTIDPEFRIVGWTARENFPDLATPLPGLPLPSSAETITFSPAREKVASAAIVNDDIPFAWTAALIVPFAAIVAGQVF